MSAADTVFDQADINHDGRLSRAEFRNLVRNSVSGGSTSSYPIQSSDYSGFETAGGYGSSAFRSSSYDTTTIGGSGGLAADAALGGVGYGASSYESSYRASVGGFGGDAANYNVAGATGAAGASSIDASSASFSSTSQTSSVQQYEADAQGNFVDSNPQIIRRPAPNGPLTLTQNIRVRFLQPPAVAPPGPLIIKEVRPPQPPLPPPLRVRQQAPPLPQQPPLILRERPPPVPAAVTSQTIVRNLAAIPVPPRSVFIERLPPAPPKPRDIIIERWVPYGAQAERKTIVQRADAAIAYPRPRNVIIQYEAPQVRVIRQFQRLGVTLENPQEYVQRYGATLFDAQTLVQQARAAGVVEDISPPAISSSANFDSSSLTANINFDGSNAGAIDAGAVGGADRSSFYESSSYSATGNVVGGGVGVGFDGAGVSSYESGAYRSSTTAGTGLADALFTAADTNNDGVLTAAEFRNIGL